MGEPRRSKRRPSSKAHVACVQRKGKKFQKDEWPREKKSKYSLRSVCMFSGYYSPMFSHDKKAKKIRSAKKVRTSSQLLGDSSSINIPGINESSKGMGRKDHQVTITLDDEPIWDFRIFPNVEKGLIGLNSKAVTEIEDIVLFAFDRISKDMETEVKSEVTTVEIMDSMDVSCKSMDDNVFENIPKRLNSETLTEIEDVVYAFDQIDEGLNSETLTEIEDIVYAFDQIDEAIATVEPMDFMDVSCSLCEIMDDIYGNIPDHEDTLDDSLGTLIRQSLCVVWESGNEMLPFKCFEI